MTNKTTRPLFLPIFLLSVTLKVDASTWTPTTYSQTKHALSNLLSSTISWMMYVSPLMMDHPYAFSKPITSTISSPSPSFPFLSFCFTCKNDDWDNIKSECQRHLIMNEGLDGRINFATVYMLGFGTCCKRRGQNI